MRLELLHTLREKLLEAEDFAPVLAYFFDHFGDDPAFIEVGERSRDPMLEEILQVTASQMTGSQAPLQDLLQIRLPQYGFVHGGFTIAGRLGTFFYFEENQAGLASLAHLSSGETKMARFTTIVPKFGEISRN